MKVFFFCVLFVCVGAVVFLWLLSILARIKFAYWLIAVNVGLIWFFAKISVGTDPMLSACTWLLVAGVVNLVLIYAHAQSSTVEGRMQMYKEIKAQEDYDNKYRNYVQEEKDRKANKGTIEYTEKKR